MLKLFFQKYKYQLLLTGLILLALYPLSLFIYIPKWDNVNGYLPYRYFISDYVWNGHLPLWNPFQRLGYPGYADLQSGAWSPIVWVIMLFGKYTINSLITELLSCYVFAGLGFFKLAKYLFKDEKTSFILGLSYALSGFMVGSSQLMVFLIAVTWFPWIVYHLLRFFENYQLKHKLLAAFFMALFITGASPSYTIILAYIVVGMFIYQLIIQKEYKRILLGGITIFIALVVLILPYINAFVEFAPYFNRVDKLEYSKFLLANPFTPVSYISFLLPFSVIAKTDWFNITDLSLRNGYFGLVALITFVSVFLSKWNRTKIILVVGACLSLLMAAGGETFIFKYLYHLPGFGVFRHPSMFRAFTIFCCLLLAGYELKYVLNNGVTKKHKIVFTIVAILVIIVGILAFTKTNLSSVKQLAKDFYHYGEFSNYSLATHVLLNVFISIALLCLLHALKRSFKVSWFLAISIIAIADLGIQTRLSIPTTVCYKISQDDISKFFDELPDKINQNDNYSPLKELDETQSLKKTSGIWQNLSTYNKTLSSVGVNPMRFKSFDEAKEDGRLDEAKNHNVIYYDNLEEEPEQITVDYNRFTANIKASKEGRELVLNQNYHHLWSAKIESVELPISQHNDLTMKIDIPKGVEGSVEFNYSSPRTLPAFIVSLLGYVLIITLVIRSQFVANEK